MYFIIFKNVSLLNRLKKQLVDLVCVRIGVLLSQLVSTPQYFKWPAWGILPTSHTLSTSELVRR